MSYFLSSVIVALVCDLTTLLLVFLVLRIPRPDPAPFVPPEGLSIDLARQALQSLKHSSIFFFSRSDRPGLFAELTASAYLLRYRQAPPAATASVAAFVTDLVLFLVGA